MSIISAKAKEDYLKEYDEYLRIKSIILDEKEKPKLSADQYDLVDLGSKVTAMFRNSTTEFNKPVYENINKKLNELNMSKKKLMTDYVFLKEKLLFGSSTNISQEEKIKFKELTEKINKIERQKQQKEMLLGESKTQIELERLKLETDMTNYIDTHKSLFNQTISSDDDITRENMMSEYVSKYNSYVDDVFKQKKENVLLSNLKTSTENYMVIFPEILQSGDSKVTLDTKVMKNTKKVNKLDKKLKTTLKDAMKKKKTTKKAKEQEAQNSAEIKNILKESLNRMLFKTMNECESSKRTQPYYMSKEEILEIIKNNPKLSKKVGTNLSKLSKKELCQKILS